MTARNTGSQSLIRGLKLLDLLSNFPNGCPLAQLAELSKLNKSTVHRLLQALQSEGYIQPTSTAGNYRLTTKCLSLGQKTLVSMNIIHLAAPHLERLNLVLGETVNFSKRENDHAIMIYKLEPTTGMMRTRSYIGQQLPLYCSAMGKIYLAYEQKQNYLIEYWNNHKDSIQSLTCNTITQIEKMEAELTNIRVEKFAMDREENELGVACIAYPIFDFFGKVEYSVSVSMSTYKIQQVGIATFLNEICQTAQDITKELGGAIK